MELHADMNRGEMPANELDEDTTVEASADVTSKTQSESVHSMSASNDEYVLTVFIHSS